MESKDPGTPQTYTVNLNVSVYFALKLSRFFPTLEDAEINRLQEFLTRAADELDALNETFPKPRRSVLIKDLRKAAE